MQRRRSDAPRCMARGREALGPWRRFSPSKIPAPFPFSTGLSQDRRRREELAMTGTSGAARSSAGAGTRGAKAGRAGEAPSSPGSAVLATLRHEAARKLLVGVGRRLVRPAELEAELQIPRNTLHRHRRELEATGALLRHDVPGPPHFVLYELSTRGLEMRDLVLSVADWLKESDSGSGTDPVGKRAWRAVTALSEGWGSAVVPALVNEPRTAAEIERELDHRLTPAQRSGLLGRLRAAGIMQRLGGEAGSVAAATP